MDKKEFIDKVRSCPSPEMLEHDETEQFPFTRCVWWTIHPEGKIDLRKQWTTPLVGLHYNKIYNTTDSEEVKAKNYNNYLQRVEKAREKYEKWFDEALKGE